MGFMIGLNGRIGRGKWWLGQLANFVILIAMMIALVGAADITQGKDTLTGQQWLILIAGVLAATAVNVSVCVKRYHDRGKSGAWFLVCFVPIIGPIWQFVELGFLRGQDGANAYDDAGGSGRDWSRRFSDAPDAVGYADIDAKIAAMKRGNQSADSASARPQASRSNTSPVQRSAGFGRRGQA
jgi:uncharacterized membrane protein YhaH (DUF805 family)